MENVKQYNKLDLKDQFNLYLHLAKLDPKKMAEFQLPETRRAFYAGFGQALEVMVNNISAMDEATAGKCISSLREQVKNFFIAETLPKN